MATPLKDERPPLTLVKDLPEPAPLVVEKRPRPGWMMSGTELKRRVRYALDNGLDWMRFHATHSPYYLGWSVRGYRRLAKLWWIAREDDYKQHIATAKQELRKAAGNMQHEAKARAVLEVRRAEFKAHKKKYWTLTGVSAATGVVGTALAVTLGSWWVQLLLSLAFFATGAYFGRPEEPAVLPVQAPTRTSHLGEDDMRRVLVEAGVVPEKRREETRGIGVPYIEGPGIGYAVHTPSGIPAANAVNRKQQIAAALGVHSDWLDLSVGSVETLLQIWVAREDPFAITRVSPLVGHRGPLDLWNDGAPLAFDKRARTILSRLRDVMMLVAGATRRGKGMFIAALNLAASKDVRVNLRLFDGKASGEHNAFARLLSTFVKKDPERLAAFLRAVLTDLDRRSDYLDDRDKSKLTEDLIEGIGGIELIVIDELATYTAKGTSPYRDEIVENLCQIAAVGASLGVLLVCATQVPEVEVVPARLRQNLITRAAMNTESPTASNVILGEGMAGQGFDASLIPLNQPGRFWFKSPDLGTTTMRTFLTEDEDKPPIIADAYGLRKAAGRLPGQWRDPIEARLLAETGASSAAGGEGGKGRIVRFDLLATLEAAVRATGRDGATKAEVFKVLAVAQPARYGRLEGETDQAWATRAGRVFADSVERQGVPLEAKKVSGPDGQRTLGYLLADVTAARNARS